MKKYTFIYTEIIRRATMQCSLVKFDRVETDDLKTLICDDKYNGNVVFIFEGWSKQEGE